MRWNVRDPPKARRCPPGLRTRNAVAHVSGSNATPDRSHAFPMKPSSYGGSVTIASTLAVAIVAITSRQSPTITSDR